MYNLVDKLLLVVGAGINQMKLIQKAKKMGCRVLVTDAVLNPPAKKYSDYFEQIDITDKEKTLKIAKKYTIDAVVTNGTDLSVPTVAYVAEKLNLNGLGYLISLNFTNKKKMRDILQKKIPNNIPQYKFFINTIETKDYVKNMNSFIVKPINSQGSRGVKVLTSYNYNTITSSLTESKNEGILIEEYIQGDEYAIESYTNNGTTQTLAISKKEHYVENDCIDKSVSFFENIIDNDIKEKINKINKQVINLLGLKNGITHAEYKINNSGIYLMEIAARGAGGNIGSLIIPYLTNFDLEEIIIFNAFGIKKNHEIIRYKNNNALLEFFDFKNGTIDSIEIDENIIKKHCLFFHLELKNGDIITDVKDSRDRKGYFILVGDSKKNLLKLKKIIYSNIKIKYKDSNS